jgi:hypothetical protein
MVQDHGHEGHAHGVSTHADHGSRARADRRLHGRRRHGRDPRELAAAAAHMLTAATAIGPVADRDPPRATTRQTRHDVRAQAHSREPDLQSATTDVRLSLLHPRRPSRLTGSVVADPWLLRLAGDPPERQSAAEFSAGDKGSRHECTVAPGVWIHAIARLQAAKFRVDACLCSDSSEADEPGVALTVRSGSRPPRRQMLVALSKGSFRFPRSGC